MHKLEHNRNIVKQNPIEEGCTVLSFVEGERKVSFIEAWHAHQSNGFRTYVL
jgi:hypothetical protein